MTREATGDAPERLELEGQAEHPTVSAPVSAGSSVVSRAA
jgi:hypothetical protein